MIADRKRLYKTDDANNLMDGRYYYVNAETPINATGANVTLFQFTTTGRQDDVFQFAFDYNSSTIRARTLRAGTWTEWKEMFSFI